MASEEPSLSAEQTRRQSEVLAECFRLMRDERSRYENQASRFLEEGQLALETPAYNFVFYIEDNRFSCKASSKSSGQKSFVISAPIPESSKEKVEELIELFAQAEAGLVD